MIRFPLVLAPDDIYRTPFSYIMDLGTLMDQQGTVLPSDGPIPHNHANLERVADWLTRYGQLTASTRREDGRREKTDYDQAVLSMLEQHKLITLSPGNEILPEYPDDIPPNVPHPLTGEIYYYQLGPETVRGVLRQAIGESAKIGGTHYYEALKNLPPEMHDLGEEWHRKILFTHMIDTLRLEYGFTRSQFICPEDGIVYFSRDEDFYVGITKDSDMSSFEDLYRDTRAKREKLHDIETLIYLYIRWGLDLSITSFRISEGARMFDEMQKWFRPEPLTREEIASKAFEIRSSDRSESINRIFARIQEQDRERVAGWSIDLEKRAAMLTPYKDLIGAESDAEILQKLTSAVQNLNSRA